MPEDRHPDTGQARYGAPSDQTQGQAAEGGAEGGQPTGEEREGVNLYELPEFQKYQSTQDRRIARLQEQLEESQRQLAETQRQVEETLLEGAEPQQQADFYRGRAQEYRQQLEEQREQSRQQQRYQQRARRYLNDLGIDANNPGLDWSGGPTREGFERLQESAARILASQTRELRQRLEERQQQTSRQQQQQQARTGAQVSTATEGGERTTDEDQLWAEYHERLEQARRNSDLMAALQVKREYRDKGLDIHVTG